MNVLSIGGVRLGGRVFLAPMAGVTSSPFRLIAKGYGAALVYSEMISASGVAYNNKKTKTIAHFEDAERPLSMQIFGSDPEHMKKGARFACECGADIVDINMGCPQAVIVRGGNGAGAALMNRPERAREVIKAVAGASSVPVSVKIRSGWKKVNALDIARIAQEEGASALACHPRLACQGFSGLSDWAVIKAVKDSLDIPVIGSGDLFSPEDARQMVDGTGCDAVMLARGIRGAPWQIGRAVALLANKPIPPEPDVRERAALLKRLAVGTARWQEAAFERFGVKEYGYEPRALCEMRKFVHWFMKGYPRYIIDNDRLYGLRTFEEFDGFLENVCENLENAKSRNNPKV